MSRNLYSMQRVDLELFGLIKTVARPYSLIAAKNMIPQYGKVQKNDSVRTLNVTPDVVGDFTNLPFEDGSFYLVVFDPPHLLRVGDNAWLKKKYGRLPQDWPKLIHDGFWECMRVLKPYGTLVFKWSEIQVSTREVITAIGKDPLFGHRSGKQMNTHWMCFMKGV